MVHYSREPMDTLPSRKATGELASAEEPSELSCRSHDGTSMVEVARLDTHLRSCERVSTPCGKCWLFFDIFGQASI